MTPTLPPEQQRLIDAEIASGETLLWAGRPAPGRMAKMGIGPMLFGIPFTAFALFWTAMAGGMAVLFHGIGTGLSRTVPGSAPLAVPFTLVSFFPLFGLIFVAAGVGLLLSPLWLSLKAKRTVYAITNKRILLWNGNLWGGPTIRSLSPAQLGDRARTQNADGSGDLVFPRAATLSAYNDSDSTSSIGYNQTRYRVVQAGFFGIPEVKAVDDLMQQAFG